MNMVDFTETSVNIGLEERKVRLVLGVILLVASLVAAVILVLGARSPAWGLVLLPFYHQGVRFILDYRNGTCPLKAELGQHKLDAKFSILGEKLEDRDLAAQIRSKSRRALVQAAAAAILLTLATVLLMALLR